MNKNDHILICLLQWNIPKKMRNKKQNRDIELFNATLQHEKTEGKCGEIAISHHSASS